MHLVGHGVHAISFSPAEIQSACDKTSPNAIQPADLDPFLQVITVSIRRVLTFRRNPLLSLFDRTDIQLGHDSEISGGCRVLGDR